MHVPRNLSDHMECRHFGRLFGIKPNQAPDGSHEHSSVRHAVQIPDLLAHIQGISREIPVNILEYRAVRMRKHGKPAAVSPYPKSAGMILGYGIHVIGTDGARIGVTMAEMSGNAVPSSALFKLQKPGTLGPEPDTAVTVLENGIYYPEIFGTVYLHA